jgi:hypothetical protein
MSNFRPINRDMDFLMPPSVDEWLPQRHLGKRLVSPAFSDADGCAELSTLKRSVRSSLRRC